MCILALCKAALPLDVGTDQLLNKREMLHTVWFFLSEHQHKLKKMLLGIFTFAPRSSLKGSSVPGD